METIRVTSEALQATVRRLLPSQNGFGDDLLASSLITPIIDLTPTAEGSSLEFPLQTAYAFGSQTAFEVNNATAQDIIAGQTGFFRINGNMTCTGGFMTIQLAAALGTKRLISIQFAGAGTSVVIRPFDFIVYLATGDSIQGTTTSANDFIQGTFRQIADSNGVLVDPAGFTPQ